MVRVRVCVVTGCLINYSHLGGEAMSVVVQNVIGVFYVLMSKALLRWSERSRNYLYHCAKCLVFGLDRRSRKPSDLFAIMCRGVRWSVVDMGSSIVNDLDEERGISPATLNTLRGILISSLSRENSPTFSNTVSFTHSRRKVTFKECQRMPSDNNFFGKYT